MAVAKRSTKMLWMNNPEILREMQAERVRQVAVSRSSRRPRLKLIAIEAEADAATVV
jgi:hypothetical protein